MIPLVSGWTKGTQSSEVTLRSLRSMRSLLLLAALMWPAAAPASAHDLEKTQVLIVFARDGSFVLDVANDPSWLKLRLQSFAGHDADPATLSRDFADRVVLWVDGREVRPTLSEVIPGDTLTTHRLQGRMPTNARTLRWYYGMVVDPYPLTIRRADGRVVVEEVQGDAWSRPIDLAGQFSAPLLSGRVSAFIVLGCLLVPVILRLRSTTRNTKNS